MNIIFNARHMESTDALKTYAFEKVKKLEKYLPESADANITLAVEKFRHKAEVQIKVNGLIIQASEETEEMYSSIDNVTDKIGRQVKKYKEKLKDHKGKGEGMGTPPGRGRGGEDTGDYKDEAVRHEADDSGRGSHADGASG